MVRPSWPSSCWTREARADQSVVIHEMVRASSRADGRESQLVNRFNLDPDTISIYSTGSARTVLKPEPAQAMSEAFIAEK